MKALTIQQPWIEAILEGVKLVENRSWSTPHRGPLGLHAGTRWSERGRRDERVLEAFPRSDPRGYALRHKPLHRGSLDGFLAGRVLGMAQLVDVHPDSGCCRPWGESAYTNADGTTSRLVHHWVLEDPQRVHAPILVRGRLGLWEWAA